MIHTMRGTRALVHMGNFRRNIGLIRGHIGKGPLICLAVKANAYGHGIVEMGREAEAAGVEYLAVATVDEAVALRSGGLALPILLYGLPTPEELPDMVRCGLIPIASDREIADLVEAEARSQRRVVTVHLKIDTGMGRIGCTPEAAPGLAADLAGRSNLRLGGVCTHLAASDGSDPTNTQQQIHRFDAAVQSIRARGISAGIVHAANSGGILSFPESWYDMVRPGILAYGYYPSDEQQRSLDIRPVMELRSRLVFIKEVEAGTPISYGSIWRAPQRTHVGTIAVGYGDGYCRLLSNRGRVQIRGESYPIAGRVCMDQIMVDLGPVCSVERFDDVVLFGPDPGAPDAKELSTICQTIPYEITCAVSKRVPRLYLN